MFKVCTIDEAKQLISEHFKDYELLIEEVSILDALDRYLATDIYARCDVPHFNRSTVDGYAVMSKEVSGASESLPTYLTIMDEVIMGKPCNTKVSEGCTIYVPTGGMLPEGADSVVMIEDTDKMNDDELFVYKKVAPKENVLFKGEDIKQEELVLKKGRKITPQDLGVLSSIGYDTVKVYQKLKFTVISTGDEIVNPSKDPGMGEIRDINSYTITGAIKLRNMDILDYVIVQDNKDLLRESILRGIDESDVVVISGGSSVGQKDLTHQILNEIEKDSIFVHGIAIKPGKPTILAKVKNKLVFGLPGQPASALLVFKTFIEHIEHVLLRTPLEPEFYLEAKLTKNVFATPGRVTYQMVNLIHSEDGILAEPIYGKSGTITLIASALGFVKISSNQEGLQADEVVKVYKL